MTDMRALLVGGSGMIGASLARRLLRDGWQVTVTARRAQSSPRLAGLADLQCFDADCRDAEAMAEVVRSAAPVVVFHLASSSFNPPTTPAHEHLAVNAMGTLNVLEAARAEDVKRVVLTGSAAEYTSGNDLDEFAPTTPGSVYGATKLCGSVLGETYARSYGLPVVNLRFFTPFGPWEQPRRLIPSTILAALAGEPVRIGSGTPQRDFLYVEDAVDALIAAATKPVAPGATFNICSGTGTSVRDAVETILELMQSRVPIEASESQRPDEITKMSGDWRAAARDLDWRPKHDFHAGLEKTIAWVSAHRDRAAALP